MKRMCWVISWTFSTYINGNFVGMVGSESGLGLELGARVRGLRLGLGLGARVRD